MNNVWKNLRSIRWRLTLWFSFALTVALVVFSLTVYFAMRQALTKQIETSLQDDTLSLAEILKHEFEEGAPLAVATGTLIRDASLRNLEIEIYAPDGSLLAASNDSRTSPLGNNIELNKLPAFGEGLFRSEIGRSKTERSGLKIAAVRVVQPGTGESFALVVGAGRSAIYREMNTLRKQMLTFAPLLVLLAAIGGFYLARRAMQPVAEMTAQARTMNANRLSERLAIVNPNDELGQLGITFNELFDRIETSFEQMRQFIADASHELRTPVTVIRSETEVALTDPRNEREAFESLEVIHDEAIRLSRLVEDMFTLARADADDYNTLSSEPIPLGELVETCARSVETLGRSRGVAVELNNQIPPDAVVSGDRIRVAQMILNILDNATKYVHSGGNLKINAEINNDHPVREARIFIEDDGPGISDELKEAVFNRFYRVDKARTRVAGGSGLGLPIARSIAEAHGGGITLADSASGGCLFIINLPVTAA